MNSLDIIYEDNDMILVHKPAGVATQTKRLGQQDMESLLKNYRAKKGEPPYIGVVHRLDQPVEGIMVFAKNQKAAANLSKQVQQHVIGKYYYAVTSCMPTEKTGVLEDYLLTDKKTNVTQVVEGKKDEKSVSNYPKDAKKAKLEYQVVDTKEDKTLIRIKLHTGRQHQIRVQMAHMGCPLVGDSKYGNGNSEKGLALCSYRLEFEHPMKRKKCEFEIYPKGGNFGEFVEIKTRHFCQAH